MKPFRIITSADEVTHVPFELPVKGKKALKFSIPRLNFLSEQQAREVRDNLRDIDKPVPLFDQVTGDPLWDESVEGERKQLEGPEPRTPMDRTKVTALAMLCPLVSDQVADALRLLTAGELEQIVDHWTEVSGTKLNAGAEATDLGESSASSTS